eukprot:sb/3474337/
MLRSVTTPSSFPERAESGTPTLWDSRQRYLEDKLRSKEKQLAEYERTIHDYQQREVEKNWELETMKSKLQFHDTSIFDTADDDPVSNSRDDLSDDDHDTRFVLNYNPCNSCQDLEILGGKLIFHQMIPKGPLSHHKKV